MVLFGGVLERGENMGESIVVVTNDVGDTISEASCAREVFVFGSHLCNAHVNALIKLSCVRVVHLD